MARPDDETNLDLPDDDATRPGTDSATSTGGALPLPPSSSGFEIGDAFGSRYRVLKELGAGGMGVVYQAWDQVLNVVVALKVIRPDVTADPTVAHDIERRFKRELLLARKVTHKNVVRIHDLGDVGGTKYITMPFVEGDDLATTLKRDGKLPVARVMPLARQLASGLEAAHDAGVVHRDLKPANIMVDGEGHPLIMDFGIALSAGPDPRAANSATAAPSTPSGRSGQDETMLSSSGATTAGRTTMSSRSSGSIVGTLEYMSPEQSKGDAVDLRSDIYSLGLILRDLLLGPRKLTGTTAWEALQARVTSPPVALATIDPSIPADLDAVITRCLQLSPADRYQTTRELVEALNRLDDEGVVIPEPRRFTPRMMAAAAVLLLALIAGTWWAAQWNQPTGPREPVTVLVANFTNSTKDPLFDGFVEPSLTLGIETAAFVEAYSRRDATRLATAINKDATLDAATAKLIALREGIDVVLSGDLARSGDGYILRVQAIRPGTESDEVLLTWDATAGSKDDVLDIIGEGAERVRSTLGDTKSDTAAADAETFTAASVDAAKAYAEGQEHFWAGRANDAIAAYQRTVKIDPNFGRAYSGMAALYANQNRTQEAEAAYEAALGMINRMTEREKYRTRGGYYLFKRNGDKAKQEFTELVDKFPADTSGVANLAYAHFLLGDYKTARDMALKASDAYPTNRIRRMNAALFAMYAGEFEETAKLAAEILKVHPTYEKAFVALAISHLALGRPGEATATYQKLVALGTATARTFAPTGLVDVALHQGRQKEALALLDEAIKQDRTAGDGESLARRMAIRAELQASMGNKAAAIRDAEAAVVGIGEHGVLFTAGRAFIAAGRPARAMDVATDLDNRLEAEPRAYGALLRGEVALAAGRAREAFTEFEAAQKLKDTWMGTFNLGRAYLALGEFIDAGTEFDRCLSRRGEATALFLDDLPTYRVMAPLDDYLRRAKQRVK